MSPDTSDDSGYFGVWPALLGYIAGAVIIWTMFELATGML